MISAEARKLNYNSFSPKQTRGIRRKRINKEEVRRWLLLSGVLLSLMTVNSILQALLAQTQLRLEDAQAKVETLDKELGQLQYELAGLGSYDRVESVASTKLGMLRPIGFGSLRANNSSIQTRLEEIEIPLYKLTAEHGKTGSSADQQRGIVHEISRLIAGLGRTMANDKTDY
jgi:cell division protein FtsL